MLIHANTEEVIRTAVASPLTLFASDGFDVYPRNGHPRSAGTYSRILGRYVREQGVLTLMDSAAQDDADAGAAARGARAADA